ncbi:MAG: methionyl-tRNA formyltransferase [Patescibacteria group bacterium]
MITFQFFGSDNYSKIVLNELLKDKNFKLIESNPDVGILASYGKILDKKTVNSIKMGILNVHPSLLPKYRGPAPVQSAIINGETETGVTVFKLDEKIDHGPILGQKKEEIRKDDTSLSLYNRLFILGAQIIKESLENYLNGSIKLTPQDHKKAIFTIKKLDKENGFIDPGILSQILKGKKPDKKINFGLFASSGNIHNIIRGLYPWPCAWTMVKTNSNSNPKRLKLISSHLQNEKLFLDRVQLEGKKEVTFKQFKEGYPDFSFS